MANWWKFKREMARLGQQIMTIPEAFWEPKARQRHDALVKNGLPTHQGQVQQTAKIALVLIYQPKDIAASLLATCKYLTDAGYAPFIVSNTNLDQTQIEDLLPVSWRIMIRPNFGYDFGGYRDGILALGTWGITPDKLLVMNDSVWFPLDPATDLIARMETSNAALSGPILRAHRRPHFIESYIFLISGPALQSDAIQAFWKNLAITSNKYKVIRRGERGLSKAFQDANLSIEAMFSGDAFAAEIAKQSAETLRKTLLYAALPDDHDRTNSAALVAQFDKTEQWRETALAHILDILSRGEFHINFPYASATLMGFPMLKKSSARSNIMWRKAYHDAVKAGDIPEPRAPYWAEIQNAIAADQP